MNNGDLTDIRSEYSGEKHKVGYWNVNWHQCCFKMHCQSTAKYYKIITMNGT